MTQTSEFSKDFALDVRQGLTSNPKKLSSRFFYDSLGDSLFQEIMELPEYYLTRLEYRILLENKEAIVRLLTCTTDSFDLIDLGAGDAKKTKVLIKELLRKEISFSYVPIDISQNSIEGLSSNLLREFPRLRLSPIVGTYHQVLQTMKAQHGTRRVFLLLGSNIGNLIHQKAIELLSAIREAMGPNDLLFAGFDQKKDPAAILAAYDDSQGVTEKFNLNLLERINREFDANFRINNFLHWPYYNPETGEMKSFLVSKVHQEVNIKSLNLTVSFRAWESIHVEISQKYDDQMVQDLALQSGLEVKAQIGDVEELFKNYLFKRTKKHP